MKKLLPLLLFLFVLGVSTFYKLADVWGNNTAFTIDQGRDLVDIRQMVVSHTPRLVGPTTSINGVLLGPFWYYFNLIPFLVSGGNPMAIVFWQIVWYQLSAVLFWLYFRKRHGIFALTFSLLYLFMPIGFNTARYFWNANSMPFFTALFFLALITSPPILLGLVSGLAMQVEAAFGILFFPFAFVYLLIIKKPIKQLVILSSGFFLTLIPQIIFEFRHGFLMTKTFLNEFQGQSTMLGDKLPFPIRLYDRIAQFIGLMRDSNHLPENVVYIIYSLALSCLAFHIVRKRLPIALKSITFVGVGFIVFAAIFYLLFPQKLKIWYTLGFSFPLILLLSVFVSLLVTAKNKIFLFIGYLILLGTVVHTIMAQNLYLNIIKTPSTDPSNIANQLADIDRIYTLADGKPFAVYSYLPSVYDYPYHYLFWWYGTKTYGYQPYDVAYLPNQPEYIKGNKSLWTKTKPDDGKERTILLIENDPNSQELENLWKNNFSSLCLVQEMKLPWRSTIQERQKCQP